jgi:hypothetical protein
MLKPFLSNLLLPMALLLTSCQAVPLPSASSNKPSPRPIPPVMPQKPVRVPEEINVRSGFKIADTKTTKTTAKTPTKPKPGSKTPNANDPAILQRLEEAEDKAASALSLQSSAQTKDDWNLVFDRWKRAIALLSGLPQKPANVQKKLAEYKTNLAAAQSTAQSSLNRPVSTEPISVGNTGGRPVIVTTGDGKSGDGKSPEGNKPGEAKPPEGSKAPESAPAPQKSP